MLSGGQAAPPQGTNFYDSCTLLLDQQEKTALSKFSANGNSQANLNNPNLAQEVEEQTSFDRDNYSHLRAVDERNCVTART